MHVIKILFQPSLTGTLSDLVYSGDDMKHKILLAAITACITMTIPLYAEYVFLKDGSIIQGQILKDAAGSITIRDNEKKVKTIPRTNIMRVLYTQLYMGKVYVQKTDGKSIICYMVDEDQETYTFREDLYKPVEFKLKRDQVMFMARGNPTGLQGEPGTDSIDLKWFPPYNPVKKYRLYLKVQGEVKYTKVDEFRGTTYSLKKLKSNTKYNTYVTALDAAGDESLPSNEFTFTTLNIKPDRPLNLRLDKRTVQQTEMKKGKKVQVEVKKQYLAWDEVKDTDGTIKGYNIYEHKDGRDVKIATVKNNEYEIPDGKSVYDLKITAIDDRGDESVNAGMRTDFAWGIDIKLNYLVPAGDFSDMVGNGFGALFLFRFNGLFSEYFNAGFGTGIRYYTGSNEYAEKMYQVPLIVNAGVNIPLLSGLSLVPEVSAGYAFNSMTYKLLNSTSFDLE
jgi:hypothetical protein